jgi:hypothetical protein
MGRKVNRKAHAKTVKNFKQKIDPKLKLENSKHSDKETTKTNEKSKSENSKPTLLINRIDSYIDNTTSSELTKITKTETSNISLSVELKLSSIDKNCTNYTQLTHKFLCIDKDATIDHIKKLIFKNMNICETQFEVIFLILKHFT